VTLPGFVSVDEVQEITGLSRTTLWRLERGGRFPGRVQLSERRVAYPAPAVQAWLDSRPVGVLAQPAALAEFQARRGAR
jgi:predicted DNA-binding transcriptional regulator AlpA